jgi:SAM-dependent methyltransferase
VAADINDEMLELGRAWAAEEGLRVDYRHMDLTREVPEASFDATVALECLTTIPDLDAALAQLARSLVPGGLFIAHVPDRDWRPVLPGSPTEWETAVRHGFDAAGLAAQLDAHGLRVTWTQPTMRTPLHVAQELRDRVQHKPARVRLALHPLLMVTAALELRGLAFGPARGLYVEAVRR